MKRLNTSIGYETEKIGIRVHYKKQKQREIQNKILNVGNKVWRVTHGQLTVRTGKDAIGNERKNDP